jgi:hypothetical protein
MADSSQTNGQGAIFAHRFEDDSQHSLETGLAGLEQTASEILRVLEGGRSLYVQDHSSFLKQTQDEMLRTQVRRSTREESGCP